MSSLDRDDFLFIRAIRDGWKIPADRLPAVIDRVLAIATSTDTPPADVCRAARALASFGKLQLEAIRVGLTLEERVELRQRIEALRRDLDDAAAVRGISGISGAPPRTAPPGYGDTHEPCEQPQAATDDIAR
jgi:hypothetical protein